MDPITVTIDPSSFLVDYNKTLGDLILDRVASALLDQYRSDDILRNFRDRITAIRDEEIRNVIAPKVAEVVGAAIQETDGFGNAKGPARSFQEIIIDHASRFLTTPTKDSYGTRNQATPVQKFIQESVSSTITQELKKALDEARTEVREAVKMKGAELIESAIAEMARVKR